MNSLGYILQVRIKSFNTKDDQAPKYWLAKRKDEAGIERPALLHWDSASSEFESAYLRDFFCWKNRNDSVPQVANNTLNKNDSKIKFVKLPAEEDAQLN